MCVCVCVCLWENKCRQYAKGDLISTASRENTDLGQGGAAVGSVADGKADDALLAQRRVEAPVRACCRGRVFGAASGLGRASSAAQRLQPQPPLPQLAPYFSRMPIEQRKTPPKATSSPKRTVPSRREEQRGEMGRPGMGGAAREGMRKGQEQLQHVAATTPHPARAWPGRGETHLRWDLQP